MNDARHLPELAAIIANARATMRAAAEPTATAMCPACGGYLQLMLTGKDTVKGACRSRKCKLEVTG